MKRFRYIAVFMMILFFTNSIILYAVPKPAEIINMPPTIDLSARPKKKPVDIVIMTDYTSTKLVALQNQINLLKAKFENVNVDPVFHVVNDMKKIGTQTDAIYNFERYGRYKYQVPQYTTTTAQFGSKYYFNQWFEEVILWEQKQALESDYSNLPKRTPTNVTFTRGSLVSEESVVAPGKTNYTEYYPITVRCNNDVKANGTTQAIMRYYTYIGNGFEKDMIMPGTESASVDTKWTKTTKVRDVVNDIYSVNFDNIGSIGLRSGSDRYMLFISDANSKDYSQSQGNYFSFGEMTDTIKNYITNNGFVLYGVTSENIRAMNLLNEKAVSIATLGDVTLFYMETGDIMQLGNPSEYRNYDGTRTGISLYPELIENIGVPIKTEDRFILTEDGSVYYHNYDANTFKMIGGLPAITNIVSNYMLDDTGRIWRFDLNTETLSGIGSITGFKDIIVTNSYVYFLNNNGYLYYIKPPNYSLTLLTTNIEGIYAYSYKGVWQNGSFRGLNLVTKSKQIISAEITDSQPYVNPVVLSLSANRVVKVENDSSGVYYYLDDGTVKYITSGEVVPDRGSRYGVRKDTFATAPFTDIVKSYKTETGLYFLDKNSTLYYANISTINSLTLRIYNLGVFPDLNDIAGTVEWYIYQSTGPSPAVDVLMKNTDGTIRKYTINKNSGSRRSDTILNIGKVRSVFTANSRAPLHQVRNNTFYNDVAYFINEDGKIYGYGNTEFGQLGSLDYYIGNVRNPILSKISIDKTKIYYSLQYLFKSSLSNKFYPVGQYVAVFDDIYKQYENASVAGSMYVLLGDEIEYESAYSDRENDPEYQRKWIISHDPNYFDNSMGLSIYHNPTGFTTSPPTKLDKVGKYVINLKARDNPKNNNLFDNYRLWSTGDQNLTLYVHRKPIPLMNLSVTQNADETFKIIATDGGSYDLDHTSMANKGIVEWEWAWRDQWEDSWHYERMNRLDATGDRAYIISLRVKDLEGVWSDWIYQTIDNRQPPIAKFDITKNPITSVELAQIKDTSYAVMSNLTNWHWIVKKINDNGTIGVTLQEVKPTSSNTGAGGYDTSLNLTRTNPGVGKYRIYLRVKADNGLWSDGGTDAAPNIDNMFYRDLTVNQALSIGDISITGRWNHFRGWTDKFGVWKDVMKDTTYKDEKGVNRYPYRFLSYEMIDIKIKLEGYADEVSIDFPVNSGSGYSLGSMYYKDRLGYEYSYQEDLGYTVNFPYKGPFKNPLNPLEKDPTIEWSYILPLVHSSASWENNRLYQPYEIKITAKKGNHEVTQIKKIDITGNVDDLIFIQPVAR